MAEQVLAELATHDASGALIRAVDHDVRPGVEVDMGTGDHWPTIRAQLMAADILVLATPTWMGSPRASPSASWNASTLSFPRPTSKAGRSPTPRSPSPLSWATKTAPITSVLFQCLNDVGFTLPAGAVTYWNDEAASEFRDCRDLSATPTEVTSTMATLARNAAHLARLLKI